MVIQKISIGRFDSDVRVSFYATRADNIFVGEFCLDSLALRAMFGKEMIDDYCGIPLEVEDAANCVLDAMIRFKFHRINAGQWLDDPALLGVEPAEILDSENNDSETRQELIDVVAVFTGYPDDEDERAEKLQDAVFKIFGNIAGVFSGFFAINVSDYCVGPDGVMILRT